LLPSGDAALSGAERDQPRSIRARNARAEFMKRLKRLKILVTSSDRNV
jgi:hypothetical protein